MFPITAKRFYFVDSYILSISPFLTFCVFLAESLHGVFPGLLCQCTSVTYPRRTARPRSDHVNRNASAAGNNEAQVPVSQKSRQLFGPGRKDEEFLACASRSRKRLSSTCGKKSIRRVSLSLKGRGKWREHIWKLGDSTHIIIFHT